MTATTELIAEARKSAPGDDATDLAVTVHRLADALEAAVQQPNREVLALVEQIGNHVAAEYEEDPALDDMILRLRAAVPIPATGEPISSQQFDVAAEAFYETTTDPALNEQGNRRKALANALAAIGIEVTP